MEPGQSLFVQGHDQGGGQGEDPRRQDGELDVIENGDVCRLTVVEEPVGQARHE